MQSGFGCGQRGAVLPLVAICLAVLMGSAGMAIDIGFLEYHQQVQQAATDAAAVGGAQAAYKNSCSSNASAAGAAAIVAAQDDATLNGFTSGVANVTVGVTPDPSTGDFASNPCAVDVTITTKNVPTFFSQIFGFFGMTESTHAVGLAPTSGSSGCVWLLSTGSSETSNFSNSTVAAPGCSIYINSTGSSNMSNASIDAGYIGYGGQAPNEGGATFASATPAPMSAETDPCSTIAGCAYLTNNAASIESQNCANGSFGSGSSIGNSSGTQTVCYSSLQVSGSNVTVCGLIEVIGAQLNMSGGATVNSCPAGVTFFLGSQTNNVNLSSSYLTLSAPTSGNTAGVLFWRDPSAANEVTLSSADYRFSGLIYFPTAFVTYSAGSSGYTQLVFGSVNFSASTTLSTPPPSASGPKEVTLGE